jgi:hypothetical protein
VKVGSGVGVGLAGVDDGGAVDVGEAVTGALVDAVGPDVALVLSVGLGGADWVADVVGAAELLVGAGAGGPKHPASANREQTPRTLNDESLGLVMMPPRVRAPGIPEPTFKVRRSRLLEQGLRSDVRNAHTLMNMNT